MVTASEPRSAYLHVPFCAHRCGYCNFAITAGRDDLQPTYLLAIERELAALGHPRPVDTLYFGGGTPTQLSLDNLDRLCRTALRWFSLAAGYEWTVEANPLDITPEIVDLLRGHGVNRVSLGGQSFSRTKLAALERDHPPQQVEAAVLRLKDSGIAVALDLIFAAPNESLREWQADVEAAVRLGPQHLSTYGLTIEKGTSFWSRRDKAALEEVDEETQRTMYLHVVDALSSEGFEHYEVSNFARVGCRSRHNEA
ncbi:MAG: coproporphyrinogen III oxidase family protein, partial [Planctomycetales bacterium]|nr:coproporphyrinogen III oxidase family protein [Planctomycetales bacterium]